MGLSSASVEEYLEAIYSLNEKGELAKNQDLSEKLKVSPPSVTQMIQRLAHEGLVLYEPYKGTQLTGKGMALAQKVVRKHRLLEVFLHDTLKLPMDKVHEQACKMAQAFWAKTNTLGTPQCTSYQTSPSACGALNGPVGMCTTPKALTTPKWGSTRLN